MHVEVASWARISAILGGLGCCGSLGVASCPRPFFATLDTG